MVRRPSEVWLIHGANVKGRTKIFSGCYNRAVVRGGVVWLVTLWLSGCATGYNAGTARDEIILIDSDREARMGASIAKEIARAHEFTLSNDPVALERIDRIGQRLAAVSDRKELTYHFHLLQWDEANAFAVPGGYVYLSTTLLALMRNDDELASVLGHEIGHVVAKHSIKQLQASLGATLVQILVAASERDPETARGTQMALTQLFLAHSRQDELEADRLAVRYLQRAGFNPEGAITAFERMQAHQRTQPSHPFSYARTHPFLDDRIRLVKQTVRGHVDFDDYINMTPENR